MTCFYNLAMNKGALKLNEAAHLLFFIAPPRASISCDLLVLTDFYWPRANGPVLVSIPEMNQKELTKTLIEKTPLVSIVYII